MKKKQTFFSNNFKSIRSHSFDENKKGCLENKICIPEIVSLSMPKTCCSSKVSKLAKNNFL